jgi:hypothetical protein
MAVGGLRPPPAMLTDIREFTRWCKESIGANVVTDDELTASAASVTSAFQAADAAHVAAADPHPGYTTAAEVAAALATFLATANTWSAKQTFSVPHRLPSYSVAGLPAGVTGDRAIVTDASGPTFLAAAVGGGAVVCPVFHNGTTWIVG